MNKWGNIKLFYFLKVLILLFSFTGNIFSMQKSETKLHRLPRELKNLIAESIKNSNTLQEALKGLYNLSETKLIRLDNKAIDALIDDLFNKFRPDVLLRIRKMCGNPSYDPFPRPLRGAFYNELIEQAIKLKFYEFFPVLIDRIIKEKFDKEAASTGNEAFDHLAMIANSITENKQEPLYSEINKIVEYFSQHLYQANSKISSMLKVIVSNKNEALYPLVKKYLPLLSSQNYPSIVQKIITEKLSSLYYVAEWRLKADLEDVHSLYERYPATKFDSPWTQRAEKLISDTLKQLEALKRQ